ARSDGRDEPPGEPAEPSRSGFPAREDRGSFNVGETRPRASDRLARKGPRSFSAVENEPTPVLDGADRHTAPPGSRNDCTPAMRIVSLLGSATEIVHALGLGDHLVGISHECDYPPAALHLPRVSRPRFDPEGLTSG